MSESKQSDFLVDYPTILSIFDNFSQEIRLHVNRKYVLRSSFGGFLTIVAVVIAMVQSFEQFVEITDRSKVDATSTTQFSEASTSFLTAENFTLAFGVSNTSHQIESSMLLDFKLYVVTEKRANGITLETTLKPVPLIKCKNEQLGGVHGLLFCPERYSFPISGSSSSETFQKLELQVSRCNNLTTYGELTTTCKTSAEMDRILAKADVELQVMYQDHIINLQNYREPFNAVLSKEKWVLPPSTLTKMVSMEITETSIISDADILSLSPEVEHNQTYTISGNWKEQILGSRNNVLFSLNFKKSVFNITYQRIYRKITDALAQLGGLLKIYLAVLGAIAVFYNRFSYKMQIINQMYDFEDIDTADEEQKIAAWQKKVDRTTSSGIQGDQNAEKQMDAFKTNFAKTIAEKGLFFSFTQFIWSSVCRCESRLSKKLKLYRQGEAQIRTDLDAIQIIKKLQEFDKFKQLFLTADQLALFAYSPKPYLTLPTQKQQSQGPLQLGRQLIKKMALFERIENYSDFDSFMKLFQSYKNLKADDSPHTQLLNQLLLGNLDKRMRTALQTLQSEMQNKRFLKDHLKTIYRIKTIQRGRSQSKFKGAFS